MVKSENRIIPRKEQFRYFGSIIQKGGEINEDVTHRIKAIWFNAKVHPVIYVLVDYVKS